MWHSLSGKGRLRQRQRQRRSFWSCLSNSLDRIFHTPLGGSILHGFLSIARCASGRLRQKWLALFAAVGLFAASAACAEESFSFGVISQRSAVLTAQYWNPILEYVQKRTGVKLVLKVARSGLESSEAAENAQYDFIYSNQIFQPKIVSKSNYQVILRPREEAITGQIVTLADSSVKTIKDLSGQEVGFPSKAAFVGYAVPMDYLLRQNITVTPVFGGNQEGIMAQLKAGRVPAAGVNSHVMKAFAARENLHYRVLWESVSFHNIPIAVLPSVPKAVVESVKSAIDGMELDPEGAKILEETAKVIAQKAPYGYQRSSNADYRNYQDFYKHTLLKDYQ